MDGTNSGRQGKDCPSVAARGVAKSASSKHGDPRGSSRVREPRSRSLSSSQLPELMNSAHWPRRLVWVGEPTLPVAVPPHGSTSVRSLVAGPRFAPGDRVVVRGSSRKRIPRQPKVGHFHSNPLPRDIGQELARGLEAKAPKVGRPTTDQGVLTLHDDPRGFSSW